MVKKISFGLLTCTFLMLAPMIGQAEDVMSYSEFMDVDEESLVTIETYVQAKQKYKGGSASLHTQDRDGAYFVYEAEMSEEDYNKIETGTKILVTGYKTSWSGEVEIVDASIEIIDDGDTYIADPFDVTNILDDDSLINYQNQYVAFSDITVEASVDVNGSEVPFLYGWDGSGQEGDDLYFNISYDDKTHTFVVESDLCDSTSAVYQTVLNMEIGDHIDTYGFLYWYDGVNPLITEVNIYGSDASVENQSIINESDMYNEQDGSDYEAMYYDLLEKYEQLQANYDALSSSIENGTTAESAEVHEAEPAAPSESIDSGDLTLGQQNALKSAESYLSFSAFSYKGLIDQLEFEGYSTEEATFAADNCGADWNEQAVKSAESYLSFSSFSRDGLISQLEYEGFTTAQAEYAVDAVGY